ncbi:MAG: hypothetical protein M1840_001138 [Geoglossum simile]|nr:MAG: hypothetical protein M1840_001138 [Geoglossum simile]
MEGLQDDFTTVGEEATIVRFFKPEGPISQIHFRRSAAPSPESMEKEDSTQEVRE